MERPMENAYQNIYTNINIYNQIYAIYIYIEHILLKFSRESIEQAARELFRTTNETT